MHMPILLPTKDEEELYLYLSTSSTAISSTLIREEDRMQYLVYFVSRAYDDTETRYSPIERVVLALVNATRKLHPYFQAYEVVVLTEHPL